MAKTNTKEKKEKKEQTPATRIVTFNVHRALKGYHGKQKAPRAIRELKKLALREMGTKKVLINPKLNLELWSGGIRHCPHKMRIKIVRKYDNSNDASQEMISELEFVRVDTFHDLATVNE